MTPQEFIAQWQDVTLTERNAYQPRFLDLCGPESAAGGRLGGAVAVIMP